MARARRDSPGVPHRAFVLVDEKTFRKFHEKWREIDRLWAPCGDPEMFDVIAGLRATARDELRAEIRRDALVLDKAGEFSAGSYLVPV